jgi:type IV pilus assembly protein PilW
MKRTLQAGFSLVEMMIAMTIGLMITAGLVTIFANTSNSQAELRRTSQQIENGRYAMDVLSQDFQVTGFYGPWRNYSAPTVAPDPCSVVMSDLTASDALPVQPYSTGTSLTALPALPPSCGVYLPAANLAAGSDVVVIRRADTTTLSANPGTATTAGTVYMQGNAATTQANILQLGGGTTSCTSKADGTAATEQRRLQYPNSIDPCNGTANPAAYIRQFHVHIYFVAPCAIPTVSGGNCDSTADGGKPIPTLKRLELTSTGGVTTFKTTNISEGVEFLKVGYGIDDTPTAVNSDTGLVGDGSPDRYSYAPSLADMSNIVTARIDLLVRNPEPSIGYTDTKTYALGVDPVINTNPYITIPATALDQTYRRHVYSAEIRLVNLSSRKEIP